jgi:hypothetical protein
MGEGYRPAPIPRARPTVNARAVLAAPRARRTRHSRTHPRAPTPTPTRTAPPTPTTPTAYPARSRTDPTSPVPIASNHHARADHANAAPHRASIASKTHPSPARLAHCRTRARATPIRVVPVIIDRERLLRETRIVASQKKTYHQRAARRGDARGLIRAMLHARAAKGQRAGRGERRGDGRDGGHRTAWGCDDERGRAGPHTVHSMGVDRS